MKPNFGKQYSYFMEEKDSKVSDVLINELQYSIFAESNHGYYKITSAFVTGSIVLVGKTHIYWESKR